MKYWEDSLNNDYTYLFTLIALKVDGQNKYWFTDRELWQGHCHCVNAHVIPNLQVKPRSLLAEVMTITRGYSYYPEWVMTQTYLAKGSKELWKESPSLPELLLAPRCREDYLYKAAQLCEVVEVLASRSNVDIQVEVIRMIETLATSNSSFLFV